MTNLLEMYESAVSIFPSFHQEPLVQSHLHQIEMHLKSDVRSEYIEPKDWPKKSLLFGTDAHYKECVDNMYNRIDDSFNLVKNYIKVSHCEHNLL